MITSISRNDETCGQECVTIETNMFAFTMVDELGSSGFSLFSASLNVNKLTTLIDELLLANNEIDIISINEMKLMKLLHTVRSTIIVTI